MGKESRKRKEARLAKEAEPALEGVANSATTDISTRTRAQDLQPSRETPTAKLTKNEFQSTPPSVEQVLGLLCPISMLGVCSQHDGLKLDGSGVMWTTHVHIGTGSYGRISVGHVVTSCLNPYFTYLSGRGPQVDTGCDLVTFKSPLASTLHGGDSVPFKDVLPELALLASPPLLYHDNVVDILGFFWEPLASGHDNQFAPTLILEFADQGSLKTFFSSGVRILMGQKIRLCQDICHALQTFHHECTLMGKHFGLHHGDLKPENILVFKDDKNHGYRAKLCDLGGCLSYEPSNPGTPDRYQSGTTGWKPPELAGSETATPTSDSGNVPFSWPAADAFGLGLIVAYIVLEKEPFRIPKIAEFLYNEYFKGGSVYFPNAGHITVASDKTAIASLQEAQQWMIENHLHFLLEVLKKEVNAIESTDKEKLTIVEVLEKSLCKAPQERIANFIAIYQILGGDILSTQYMRTPLVPVQNAFAASDLDSSVQGAINSIALTAGMPCRFHSWLATHLEKYYTGLVARKDESTKQLASYVALLRGLLSFIPPHVSSKSSQGLKFLEVAAGMGSIEAGPLYSRLAAAHDRFELTATWRSRLLEAAIQGSILAREDLPREDREHVLESSKPQRLAVMTEIETTLQYSINHVALLLEQDDIFRALRMYLQNGWNVNAQSLAGALSYTGVGYQAFHPGTALHWAVEANNLSAAEVLIAGGANPYIQNSRGITPWGLAVECRLLPMVKLFNTFVPHPDPSARARETHRATHRSALIGYISTGKSFVDRTADLLLYLRKIDDLSRLEMYEPAVSSTVGDVRLLIRLLEIDFSDDPDETLAHSLLRYAIISSDSDSVRVLLALLPPLDTSNRSIHALCLTIQVSGISSDTISRMLLEHLDDDFDINTRFTYSDSDQTRSPRLSEVEGQSLLHIAFSYGRIAIAIDLLNRGASPTHLSIDKNQKLTGLTPLGKLLFSGTHSHCLALKTFLESDYIKNHDNQNFMIDHALLMPHLKRNIFHFLCGEEDGRVHETATHKTEAMLALLQHCASKVRSDRLVELLNARMGTSDDDESGFTPLHIAASTGFAKAVGLLSGFGADPLKTTSRSVTEPGETPLQIAKRRDAKLWERDFNFKFNILTEAGFPWISIDCPVAMQMKEGYESRTRDTIRAFENLLCRGF
ncbi:Fc.00g055310.m01.CDS01 [Cosmosporella sp. VM-42]